MTQKREEKKRPSEFITRTLSGAILLVVVIGALLWSRYTFLLLLLAIGIGSQSEFYKLCRRAGANPSKLLPMAISAMLISGCLFASPELILLSIVAGVLIFALEVWRNTKTPLLNVATSIGGIFYTALPMGALALIATRGGEYDYHLVLAIIAITWLNDIFAYIVGVSCGRHKLFPRISPKKSWEGFFGGVFCAIGAAVGIGALMGQSLIVWGGLGAVVALSAVVGDLVESMFKRSVDVKDSGKIMPGHGGMMDRFDALIYSAPFALIYLTLTNL